MPELCDSAGTRTQDPYIKSVLLYQLSYRIYLLTPFLPDWERKDKHDPGSAKYFFNFAGIFFFLKRLNTL